jgi:hypothetical protein
MVLLMTADAGLVNRGEVFEEADLDVALARFEELHPQTPRLENAASQAYDRLQACFAARDWDAMAEMLASDAVNDDRRRVVGAGLREGHGAVIAEMSALAEIGVKRIASDSIATRGRHLVLSRSHAAGHDQRPDAFRTDVLNIVQIDADERIVALVIFDPEDFDAAIAELDTRYLAGEGAAHSHPWLAITQACAALNRGEVPATTPDFVDIDHRSSTPIGPGDLVAYLNEAVKDSLESRVYVEAVHRITDRGAVITRTASGTSREGLEAEWRMVDVFTVEGDLLSHYEIFDEADLDAALARFEELRPQPRRLENAASEVIERFLAHFPARKWDAMSEILADNSFTDDRRRLVGVGPRHDREVIIADWQAVADVGTKNVTATVIAARGDRLALCHLRFSGPDLRPDAFRADVLGIVEINAENRIAVSLMFDLDDIDGALAELDARYIAGEAAAHSHTWSVIADAYAALNRHEFPATAPNWVNIEHRGAAAFGPGDLIAYLRASLDFEQDFNIYIEVLHRLTGLGAVITYAAHATTQEGFEAEWRGVSVFAVEGDMINHWEVFDEADLDAALARFDELHSHERRLENAATRVDARFFAHWRACDWAAAAETLTNGSFVDDRRRTVNAGRWDGRDVTLANMQALAEVGADITLTVIATRGERLALTRICSENRDLRHGGFRSEMLGVVEINTDDRIAAHFVFEADDIDAAFEHLDARYIAGEAAAHARTWSVICEGFAALNRREIPESSSDLEDIDHRSLAAIGSGDLRAYLRVALDDMAENRFYVEFVHRLTDLGAVVTHTAKGTSRDGVDAEWRMVDLFSVEDGLISRCEIFDEADLDAAIARFDELDRGFDELHIEPRPK